MPSSESKPSNDNDYGVASSEDDEADAQAKTVIVPAVTRKQRCHSSIQDSKDVKSKLVSKLLRGLLEIPSHNSSNDDSDASEKTAARIRAHRMTNLTL